MSKLCRTYALVLALLFSGLNAVVQADEISQVHSEVDDIRQRTETLGPRYLKHGEFKGNQYVTERLIDGENFYRIKDYQRSAIFFMDIIENYPENAAYSDALFLYADSLFFAGDYLGARVWFQRVRDEHNRVGMRQFRQRAIERLIEIAIHLGEYEGIEHYFGQLGQMPTPEAKYVKGKYLYFKGELDRALQVLSTISGKPTLELKARYLTGVILTRQGKYQEAIEAFLKGREYEPKTNEERKIVDLLNLGAGRLYYEQKLVEHASECYQRIAQNSVYFDSALYEAASVLIQAGDTIRAEQTLEVLTVAVPDSKYIPKAKMLRGNLLLRTGRYDEAEKVFDEVILKFTPVISQLDEVMKAQNDTRRFFSDLMERSMSTLDVSSILPPLVVKWVGEETEVQRALELTGDLGTAKEYVRVTERLIRLLEAVIDGPSRVNAIPILREAKRRSQQLGNRLGQQRGRLATIAKKRVGSSSADLQQFESERLNLQKQLAALPISDDDFEKRDKASRQIYDRMRKELARSVIRIDQLSAIAIAIERYIADPSYQKDVSQDNIETVKSEIERHQLAIVEMQKSLVQIKVDVDKAHYQIGVGDLNDRADTDLGKQIRDLARRQRELLAREGGEVGKRLERVYLEIDSVELLLSRFSEEVDQEASRRVSKMGQMVQMERTRVDGYQTELRVLSDEAEEVVGGVAFENFSNVRKRFEDLILKADVGIIDVAWLLKEEHTSRISELTKGRINEMKSLDNEFQEVRNIGSKEQK